MQKSAPGRARFSKINRTGKRRDKHPIQPQTMNQFTQLTTPAATLAPRRAAKLPAPWVDNSFVQVPREFFAVMHELSKTARDVYLGHLANALSTGENAGRSFQYRDSFAAKYHCSTAKLDRGNAELAERGMIAKVAARRANNAQEWRLLAPSAWLFDSLETAPRLTQNRAQGDAKPRPITRGAEKESFKTNSAARVAVAVENSFPVPDPRTETLPIERALIEIGVSKSAAAAICDAHSIPAIEQQIVWLDERKPKSRAATIVAAIRGNWDAPGRAVTPTPATAQNGGAYAAYSDKTPDKAPDAPRLDERDKAPDVLERQARVRADIAECLARMDYSRRESFSAALDSLPSLPERVEYLDRASSEWFEMQREKRRAH